MKKNEDFYNFATRYALTRGTHPFMACILNIETTTDVCSVAVSNDFHTVWHEECHHGMLHAERLPVFVENALYHIHREGLQLAAVAVSAGPGSYTGLRIGVSTAKGVCFATDVPLLAIPTLDLMCVPLLLNSLPDDDSLLCPMIDARRMEVYAQLSDLSMHTVREVRADVVNEDTYLDYLSQRVVYFFGSGAAKCKSVITHPNARFIDGICPLATYMQPLADKRYAQHLWEDLAYFTPFYLKEFRATTPKKLL